MKQLIIDIKKCNGCPYLSHTGVFTAGGAKPCCNHPETLKVNGMDCFKRVIPYRRVRDKTKIRKVQHIVVKKIPKWCPLPDKSKIGKLGGFHNEHLLKFVELDNDKKDCDASETDLF